MGRFVGGVFGNTIGSDTNIQNTSGVFSMSDYYYIKQEGGLTPPPDGSSSGQAVDSVADLLFHNASSGDKYVKLNGGSIVQLYYDSTARYGSINGWLRMTRTGMKLDGAKYGASFTNQGTGAQLLNGATKVKLDGKMVMRRVSLVTQIMEDLDLTYLTCSTVRLRH
tara:strand:- start:359 stop:856 length:498 start_codon:yes stop_codon:yes gene_type:complete